MPEKIDQDTVLNKVRVLEVIVTRMILLSLNLI